MLRKMNAGLIKSRLNLETYRDAVAAKFAFLQAETLKLIKYYYFQDFF